MDLLLQLLGGAGYLLNKVFFSIAERARMKGCAVNERQWRIAAWVAYIIGLPLWVVIFVWQHNWIAAAVEASGAPAMCLGLLMAMKGFDYKAPQWLDILALFCIVFGFLYSLYYFGGITAFTQWLEIGLVAGFLIGTYQLAKDRPSGYLWLVLMHICCGILMLVQSRELLFWQQLASLGFIADAYWTRRRFGARVGVGGSAEGSITNREGEP